MYLEHFGLREAPFAITPDTHFYYCSPSHQEALNVLLVALRSGAGFLKLTGEVGTGKTLLCRRLLNTLDDSFVTAYIPNPFLNPTALRMALAEELGLEFARNIGQHRLLKLITERLIELNAAGKRVVLLIDEAQAIPDDSLEALRLLTNLETEKDKLLLVVLFGQPELDQRLERPRLRQLRQRILFSHRLRPLSAAESAGYLQHRLQLAGAASDCFTPRALRLLHRASRGIPRLLNVLAHKGLMAAFGAGLQRVDAEQVRRAVADTEDASPLPAAWRRPWALGALGTAACAGMGLLLWTAGR
ncbi:AAA family ATPase [Thiohalobacter sp. IOR34]|uniref:ExeA family protein n=1 Tax=Thiohalobacter sp. IOR34 TaxID=3057176 RepID=UPI0025AFEF9A|nr:AAA family ATPase [Thiohalobacter sp. IOR34]WJW75536.1 AAA family ATPase [Thiohalobacter sp. IOR34]